MARDRRLLHPGKGTVCEIRCEGKRVTIRVGLPARQKERSKPQRDAGAALAFARKQEWEQLKKGFVLVDPTAAPGEPRLHRYLSRGYTGALAIENVDGALLCNRHGDRDEVLLIGADGATLRSTRLPPNRLAWTAIHAPALERTLLKVDHQIFAWGPGPNLEKLTSGNRTPASFLDVAGSLAAWYEEPDLVVRDLKRAKDLLRHKITPQLYGGHSSQLEGALSPDGKILACCSQAGEVLLFDVPRGKPTRSWKGGFEMISKLRFTPDGATLLARELYGRGALLAFDVAKGKPRAGWPKLEGKDVADFAVDRAGSRLAIADGAQLEIFSLATMKPLGRFPLEHVLRRCTVTWMSDDAVGIHTDYGCASVYAVGS